jgi:RyR domain.
MTQVIILAAAALATAQVAHAVNRAHCIAIGDDSQLPWDDAPGWQQETVLKGVEFHVLNPDADASASHDSWMAQKLADGWVYGEVKDAEKKTHPCIVPFADLPLEQQEKDILFQAVVHAAYPLLSDSSSEIGSSEGRIAELDQALTVEIAGHADTSAQLESAQAEVKDLQAKLDAANAKAKAAKVAAGEKASGKPRKLAIIDQIDRDELRAKIAAADKVEILFGDGARDSGVTPIVVEGDAWADHALGLMLREPVTIEGPGPGAQPYHVAGFALLLDGKQVAWSARPERLLVGAGQKYQLSNDIFF